MPRLDKKTGKFVLTAKEQRDKDSKQSLESRVTALEKDLADLRAIVDKKK